MGNDYDSLLAEVSLLRYRGAILSPVNYTLDATIRKTMRHQRTNFEVIFDPQLYSPTSQRGDLPKWPHFPSDVDTADLTAPSWWSELVAKIVGVVSATGVRAVCSPAIVPRVYSTDYYELNRIVADELIAAIGGRADVLQTVIASMSELAQDGRSEEIASIVTEGNTSRVYLVFNSGFNPRREFSKTDELKGAMRLIRTLENSGVRVLVGFASSDLVLWKAAGATSCSTGKYMNLRRFTPKRWEPSEGDGGGGPVAYWFEEALLAFIREADLIRIRRIGGLSQVNQQNPFGRQILEIIDRGKGERWRPLGWRQYLYWFADCEYRLSTNRSLSDQLVKTAQQIWERVSKEGIYMDEPTNDGSWLSPWGEALG